MSEQYNQVFVFAARFSGRELSRIIAEELSPLWEVLGRPSQLMTLNVTEGLEEHIDIHARIDDRLLQYRPGVIFSVRGAETGMGTLQYYELANYGVLSISRPSRMLSFQQRFDWMRLLWSRLQSPPAIFGISGREVELTASDVETGVRDWTRLRSVPLIEFLAVSDALVVDAPANAVRLERGFLVQLQSDLSGGRGTH